MSIKNYGPNRNSHFKQGYYQPKNPNKYLGDRSKIIFRSSWEYKFMRYCDLTPEVLEWSSEPGSIKYISPIDKKEHNYYIDFYVKYKNGDINDEYLIEVKPTSDYTKPIFEGNKTLKKLKQHEKKVKTYLINMAKFKSAINFAKQKGMKFKIINEHNLQIK